MKSEKKAEFKFPGPFWLWRRFSLHLWSRVPLDGKDSRSYLNLNSHVVSSVECKRGTSSPICLASETMRRAFVFFFPGHPLPRFEYDHQRSIKIRPREVSFFLSNRSNQVFELFLEGAGPSCAETERILGFIHSATALDTKKQKNNQSLKSAFPIDMKGNSKNGFEPHKKHPPPKKFLNKEK